MDTSIRTLLSVAQKNAGRAKNPSLHHAYQLLKNVTESKSAGDAPEAFNQDLFVICAELAFQGGLLDVAKECLKMFFLKTPVANQFLCRAYLCQAQLLAPLTADNPEKLEKAVVFLLKAISFAKQNTRYHFLVYNASVLYWQFSRPFLKPNYRQYLSRSLHQVVKALDDIDDKDYEWRAQLMIALIECHLDADHKSDASHIATAAASFIKQNVPSLYKQVFGMMVRYQLVEVAKIHKDIKSSPELSVYYRICKLNITLDQGNPSKEIYSDLLLIINQIGIMTKETQGPTPRPRSRSMAVAPRGLSVASTGKEEDKKSPVKRSQRTPTPTNSKKIAADSPEKPFLLMEIARMCLSLGFANLAQDCLDQMKGTSMKEKGLFLELEFVNCDLMVKNLEEAQESYMKSSVDVRLKAIHRCEEALLNAVRHADPNIIQVGCVTLWNLCMPLLQSNLRHHIRKALTLMAEALGDIQSLLVQLRCQVHTELAKCEEDQEQIQGAMEHLRKALSLDDGDLYQERLMVALHRLELRAELYKQPERPEDQAAMIIEQARKADSGKMRMKRSLLVKAGEALAPEAFLLVLDSESDTKEITAGKGPMTQIKKLCGKAQQFQKCVKKAEGHLKRLGDENDRERARLWADLAKTARKQEVWDVCRVAARFCLLYDDERWKCIPMKSESPVRVERQRTEAIAMSESSQLAEPTSPEKRTESRQGSRPSSPNRFVPLYDKDLIRILAEINFINGEALVHLLRSEGVQLNDSPIPPVDKSKHPKGYIAKKPEDDSEWIEYCDWIKILSANATDCFLRGLSLGVDLFEPWLVCCAATYIWNYNNHILTQNRHREIIDTLTAVLLGMKRVGHAGETMMLVDVCSALCFGLMQPWIPNPPTSDPSQTSPVPEERPHTAKKQKTGVLSSKSKTTTAVSISPDALPDLKRAIEVCEHAMEVTNGNSPQDVVPIAVRMSVLQTWCMAKQMAQQQISKTLGTEDETNFDCQRGMTRAIVAVEAHCLSSNGILEFKEIPALAEVAQMIEYCAWTDRFIELQLWARMTSLAYDNKMHNLVVRCSQFALRYAKSGTQSKGRRIDGHVYMVEQEMLCYAAGILGQSQMDNMAGKNATRREAMEAFLNSTRFARNAMNYILVMTAARHYWNACLPLVGQPIERELLKEPLRIILQCIAITAEKKRKDEEKKDDTDTTEKANEGEGHDVSGSKEKKDEPEKPPSSTISDADDDLTLRAAMYGVLFQSYADKREWEEGLIAMDQAVNDMPRTKHRLLIFKHRVIVKAKLGRSVHMDIQKFKDENEDYVAHMWRRVALCSREHLEQLTSYQNAVEALNSPSNEWQKVDLLFEFGQWLYYNDFPLQDVIDEIEWAVDIILNMKSEPSARKDGKKEKKKTKGSPRPKGSGKKATPSDAGKKNAEASTGKGSDTKSLTSEGGESELNASDFIPVTKQVVVGVLPANASLTMADLTDIRQLDGLLYAHVLLTDISGRSSEAYSEYCLQAYSYVMHLWQVSMSKVGPVIKEILKNAALEPAKSPTRGKPKKDGKDKEPVKEKPKRKGPLDHLPTNTEEWSTYDVPDEVIEAFKHKGMKASGINATTITKPMLTLHYLEELVSDLRLLGYHHLTLPVLSFIELLSRDLLKSHSLNVLTHLRSLEVCRELNLKNGCNFHNKLIGQIKVNEEDQAQSREDIATWKERQIQVAREEMRVKESLARLADEGKIERRLSPAKSTPTGLAKDSSVSHLGQCLSSVTFREVWTNTAEILIRQGHYQASREYLAEAHMAAVAFDDTPLQAMILYHLGHLAYMEAQYGQAVSFCTNAQELHNGDEQFWFDTTMLMVNATLDNYQNRSRKRSARRILVQAINQFTKLLEERPNRNSVLGGIVGKLEAKLASVQVCITFDDYENINVPKVMKAVLSACQKYEKATENLLKFGYRREAAAVMKDHAAVLRRLAQDAIEKEIRHTYYLQAMNVLKEAVAVSESRLFDVQTLSSLHDLRNVVPPVQRETADLQIECADLMLEIFRVYSKEIRSKQLADQRKGSTLRMVEELISQTPNYTHMEEEWIENSKTMSEEVMSRLINAHNLTASLPRFRARCLCSIGQCLRLQAFFCSPDPPTQWIIQEMELDKITDQLDDIPEAEKPDELDTGSKHYLKSVKELIDVQESNTKTHHFLVQATDCLMQALNICLHKGFRDVASRAALELVDCCGQYDPAATSQLLALHQSCETSLHMESLLRRAQIDPVTSKLASLLRQERNLMSTDIATNVSSGNVMATIHASLEQDWQAWKRLTILPNHLDLQREFPPNFTFIVLQHSPDKKFLYASILDKSKASGGAGGGKTTNVKQTGPVSTKARVFGMDTNPLILRDLRERFLEHKQNVQQSLLQQEYQRTQQALRTKMLENLEDDMKQLNKSSADDSNEDDQAMNEQFFELLAALEDYLRPITLQLEAALKPQVVPATSTSNVPKEVQPVQDAVIVLADPCLLEMPLEALQVFKPESITSLSRDFSLQMFYHRFHQEHLQEEMSADKKKKDKAASQTMLSRIPGLKAANMKQAKIIPLERPIPPWCQAVDTMNFRYILDQYLDCSETEQHAPIDVFNKILEEYEQQFTPRWLGVAGSDHRPSIGEWEVYMTESSSFVFYGMERLLSHLPPEKLSALNIPECMIMYILDLAQTSRSFLRQSKIDVLKSADTLSLEKPLEMAMLVSLTGVKCLLANQWHCTLAQNAEQLQASMKDFTDGCKTTGETVRLLFTPYRRKVPEPEEEITEKSDVKVKAPEEPKGKEGKDKKKERRTSSGQKHVEKVEEVKVEAVDPDKDQEEVKVEEVEPDMQRTWFNLVCYGLPNLLITQV